MSLEEGNPWALGLASKRSACGSLLGFLGVCVLGLDVAFVVVVWSW